MTSIPTRKIEMKTEQKQDIHCGTCTVKGDIVACLATPCSVRSSWFANSQAAEIERLTGCLEKANIQAEKFEREWYLRGDEIDALKADAERYRFSREKFMCYREENNDDATRRHGSELVVYAAELHIDLPRVYSTYGGVHEYTVDPEVVDAAIDAMRKS